MKISLNEATTERILELLKLFPDGTKMTHIINVALNDLYNKTIPKHEENHNAGQQTRQDG